MDTKFALYMNDEFRYSYFSRVCAEREKRHLELYAEATGWPHPKLEIKEEMKENTLGTKTNLIAVNYKMVYLIKWGGQSYHSHDVDALLCQVRSDIHSYVSEMNGGPNAIEYDEECEELEERANEDFSVVCWCGTHIHRPEVDEKCTNPDCNLIPLPDSTGYYSNPQSSRKGVN